MKVLKYYIPNHIITESRSEFSNKMKELHKAQIRFKPMVLVETAPGKQSWYGLNDFKKKEKASEKG